MTSMKRIYLTGYALGTKARLGLSMLALLAMALVGTAFWSAEAGAGEPAEPVWSADTTVVQYSSVSIGANSADLFSNIGGSADLQVKSLWSYIPGRDLRLAFDDGVPNAADYTLQVGDLSLEFPEGSSGQSGFTFEDVDVDWEDGQTIHVRIVPTAEIEAAQANAPASGLPTISGRAQVGHTLTADTSGIGDADGLTNVSYAYQWLADDTEIDGATSSTYALQSSDNGKAIKVRVNFTDDAGNAETLTSAGTSSVASKANIPASGLPAISGTARVGYTLTADTSGIADVDGLSRFPYAYQWIRSDGGADADIADATDPTYALTDDDEGKTLKLRVTFNDDKGNRETLTSAATAEVGERQDKPQFLVSNLGVGAGGAGGIQRTLGAARSGFAQAFTTGTKTGGYPLGSVGIQVSNFYDVSAAADHLRVTINGVGSEGGPGDAHCTLTNPSSFPAPGVSAFEAPTGAGPCPQLATATTYFVVIEWLNPSETGSFAIIPQTYSTEHSAATGEDQGGAAGWSIADQSHYLTVSSNVRTWTTYDETASFKIEVKEPPAKANNPATGLPTISGTTNVGETLTADTSGIADADGLDNVEYSYQWLADDADISGATDSTYTLTSAEVGKAIKVRITFTDDADNEESLTSAAASGPLAGFTLLDASDQTALASLTDGIAVELDDPDGGDYAIRVDTESGSTIGSVKLELTGAKSHSQTESISPYSLYGDNGASALHGQNLPVGSYTLRATAYSKRAGGGDVLGILSVSFIVTETALTAAFQDVPDAHNGTDAFSFRIAFSEPVATSYETFEDSALTVTGGEVTSASRVGGRSDLWKIIVTPDNGNAVSVSLPVTTDCAATGAVCTEDGKKLSSGDRLFIPGPSTTGNNPATGAPTISGTAQAGETLTASTDDIADTDGLDNVSYSHQWLADDADIPGATSSTYALTDDDVGKAIKVKVTFTDDADNEESLTSAATAQVTARPNNPATGELTISGTIQSGETLTAQTSGITDSDGLTNAEYSYQWQADDADIDGATGSTYTLTDDEVGKAIKVRVTFTDDADNEEILISAATASVVARPNNPATGAPTISGTAQAGQTLTAQTSGITDSDGLTNAEYSYQWLADDADIDGATGSTYTLTEDEVGKAIKVKVSFTDDRDNEEILTSAATAAVTARANSPATGVPTISGTAQAGETLTAHTSGITDSDGLTNVSYSHQWLADDADISGATDSTYTLTDDEVGKAIKVKVTFADDADNEENLTSTATASVAARPNSPATGAPTISGTTQAGQTLTASTDDITDADGLTNVSYSYQWLADDTDILGAIGSSYTLTDDEVGKTVKVRVTFTDDKDNEESLTSAVTAQVTALPNSPATGAPTISGTAQAGETLTAGTSGIADADGLTNVEYGYQWLADDADIQGATSSTYDLTGDEVGKTVKMKVSFTDDRNNEESLTSAATTPVTAAANNPATGLPAISGTAQTGKTLTAVTTGIADADGLTNVSYSHQWLADDADIDGATDSTYTLTDDEVGKTIKVKVSFTDDADNDETLTSAATTTVAAAANNPATGLPAISGTAQAGETLTASTDDIGDADGLNNVSYSYQWLADYADIQGATSSTYDLTGDDAGKTIKVKVTFTDDKNNQETLTSAATGTVAAAPVPLTVSLENKPTSHDGSDDFSFDIRFSEEPHADFSYKTLKLHAFNVSGGSVQKAQRLQKEPESNIGWKITVRPDGTGDVTVVLPVTTDCNATGAICTGDGRMLSNRLEFTVSGPGG